MKGNGWNDIGYNFLVDKYGQVFEGRYGGIDKAVVGAHSLGFNNGSAGVALIGNYDSVGISQAARAALVKLLAWRLDVAHVDPLSFVNVLSGGSQKFPAGVPVNLRAISGHRDTYFTECPGNALYAEIPSIAQSVAATGGPKLYAPLVQGKVGEPARFTGRLSKPLPWSVTIADKTGASVASGTGTGTAIDWSFDSSKAAPGRYGWTIAAGSSVRSATGSFTVKGVPSSVLSLTDVTVSPSVISPNGDLVERRGRRLVHAQHGRVRHGDARERGRSDDADALHQRDARRASRASSSPATGSPTARTRSRSRRPRPRGRP